VSSIDLDILSFDILSTCNIHDLAVLDVDKILSVELEELEPSTVGVVDLEIGRSTRVLDID
jgi:hypothetical protein